MATATIQGITIIGTPKEIKEFKDLCKPDHADLNLTISGGMKISNDKAITGKVSGDLKRGIEYVKDHW